MTASIGLARVPIESASGAQNPASIQLPLAACHKDEDLIIGLFLGGRHDRAGTRPGAGMARAAQAALCIHSGANRAADSDQIDMPF
jgi:hypothetical protein